MIDLSGMLGASLWGGAAFVLSVSLTVLCIRVAIRTGVVARPREDRWHRKVIPLLGGIAIAGGTTLPLLVAPGYDPKALVLLAGAILIGLVGLVDDVRTIKPQTKLLAQLLAATLVTALGLRLQITGSAQLDILVTIFWIVAITNAFNLLDNMDGLAAGIAAIATAFRLMFFYSDGNVAGVTVAAVLLGATLGFLVFNRHPAQIFMGDAGSMFLGFFVSGLSLVGGYPYSRGVLSVLFLPVLVLAVPIFDTAFVTATRIFARRPISVGGRDHTSHRLVALGLSEPKAVLYLWALAAASGGVAFVSYRFGFPQSAVFVFYLMLGVSMLALYLSRVPIAAPAAELAPVDGQAGEPASAAGAQAAPWLWLFTDSSYARQVATVLLDFVLIAGAYHAAYLLRYEGSFDPTEPRFLRSVPIVIGCQLFALAAFRTYQGMWRYTSLSDLLRLVQAVTLGTALAVVAFIFTLSFEGFSRSVLVLDWILLIVFLATSRIGFRQLAEVLRPPPTEPRRVLIYGAGDGGELALREVLRNPGLGRSAVAFLDDDPAKRNRRIRGIPVIGGVDTIASALEASSADEVIVSSGTISEERVRRLTMACEDRGVAVVHSTLRLEVVRPGKTKGRTPDAA